MDEQLGMNRGSVFMLNSDGITFLNIHELHGDRYLHFEVKTTTVLLSKLGFDPNLDAFLSKF